jgi:hypothetical protein
VRKKGIQIAKEEVNVSLFAQDDPIPKRPQKLYQKILEIINSYYKGAGYKLNTQKSVAFLYTNNAQTKNEKQ